MSFVIRPLASSGSIGQSGGGLPAGGATGQVLAKTGSADTALAWVDPKGGTLGGLSPATLSITAGPTLGALVPGDL